MCRFLVCLHVAFGLGFRARTELNDDTAESVVPFWFQSRLRLSTSVSCPGPVVCEIPFLLCFFRGFPFFLSELELFSGPTCPLRRWRVHHCSAPLACLRE